MAQRLPCPIFLEPKVPQEIDEMIKSSNDGVPGSDGITVQILKIKRQS